MNPSDANITIVLSIAKIAAWSGVGYSLWRVALVLHNFYQLCVYIQAEYRMVVAQSREENPERWNDFDTMFAERVPVKVRAKGAGR